MNCRRICCLGILVVLLLPGLVFAGPIPELLPSEIPLSLLPPPILPKFPPQPVKPYVEPLDNTPLSDYVSTLRYFFPPEAIASKPATDSNDAADTHARDSAFLGSLNMSTDSIQDVEPSVIAINKDGTVWTTSVYIQITHPGGQRTSRNTFATTSDATTIYKGQLPLPPGYTLSADPFLAANPYSFGVAPGRIYASGVVFTPPTPFSVIPNGVAVWRSDDGGRTWSNPTFAATEDNPNFPARLLDKPHIAVSWHPNTLGHVYVVYVRTVGGASNEIRIAKSTDGGNTFTAAPLPISTAFNQGPQVLVNSFHGYVYVLWTDFGAKVIRMSTSLDFGQSWSAPEPVVSINSMYLEGLNDGTGPRAASFPMARYNPVANRISVVWHEREQPGSSNTDVYYISKSPSGWQPAKVRINDVQANDQFMPALDLDSTGNMIVTFYDRRNDPSNILYQVFSARIDPNGNRLEPNQLASAFQSDPRVFPDRFIGDYQDMWSQVFSGIVHYLPAWVGIPTATGIADIYISSINPVAEFGDVPPSYWAHAHIKAVVTRGSMFGCGGGNFCPTALVDRKMLANSIIVGMHQIQSSAAYNAYFDDIANDAWAPFINRMKELAITSGCGTRLYCPNANITRAQAAVFIIKGMNQTPSTAAYNAYFDDIANDSLAPYINRMYELGITTGCGFRLYCPSGTLRKDEMAVFLNRAFTT